MSFNSIVEDINHKITFNDLQDAIRTKQADTYLNQSQIMIPTIPSTSTVRWIDDEINHQMIVITTTTSIQLLQQPLMKSEFINSLGIVRNFTTVGNNIFFTADFGRDGLHNCHEEYLLLF